MRDITLYEQNAATWLCRQRGWKLQDGIHGVSFTGDEGNSAPCPICRADIVRLVDASPSEPTGAIEQGAAIRKLHEAIYRFTLSWSRQPFLLKAGEDAWISGACDEAITELLAAPPAGDGVPRVTEADVEWCKLKHSDAAHLMQTRFDGTDWTPVFERQARILDCVSYCATRQGGK